MAFGPAYKAWAMLDGANLAGTIISGYADKIAWPQTIMQLETSTMGSVSKTFVPGLSDGDTIAISGPLDSALYTQLTNCKGSQASNGSSFTMVYGPGGSVSGMPKIVAETFIASFQLDTSVAGRQNWSASLQVTGAVTNTTW